MKYLIVKPDNSVIDVGHWPKREDVRWLVSGDDLPGSYLLDEDEATELRENLGRATIVPGARYYFVTGSLGGSDSDAVAICVGAQESREAAVDEYSRQLLGICGVSAEEATANEMYLCVHSVISSHAAMVEV